MRDTADASLMGSGGWSRLLGQFRERVSKLTVFTLGVVFLCVIPLFFLVRGQQFNLALYRTFLPQGQIGPLTHAVLVLLGSGVALFSSTLAFLQYRVRRTPLLAVIGLALFWSGIVDLTQVLIFEEWMYVAWRVGERTPLGWTLARFFTASILVVAAGIALYRSRQPVKRVLPASMLVGVFVVFGAASALTVVWLMFGPLPDALNPDLVLKRPWDIPAMVVLLLGALVVFPRLHARFQGPFSYTLWLSVVPLIAAQGYLIFYSRELFDPGYLVAYGLIVFAFAIMSCGMAFDYLEVARHEKHLINALKVREARVRSVLENASEAIVMVDKDFVIQMWNPAAEVMFGYREEEALDECAIELVFGVTRDDERFGVLQSVLKGIVDGQVDDVSEVTLERRGGEEFVAEYTIARQWLEDEDEKDGNITFFVRDRTEQRKLRLRMIQMDRLITTGTLAAGVGHELSNPLTYVLAHLEMARASLSDSAHVDEPALVEVAESLNTIETGVERIFGIVRDLKLMSSFQETEKHPVDLQDAAQIAAKMTRHISSLNADLIEDYAGVGQVLGDEARLTQVFINLITNAVQALPVREAHENRVEIRIFQDGDHVVAEVKDNGVGMSDEIQEHIFEQFFTTKAVGKGTGLGLALCGQIVKSFDGRIEVESVVGEGSVFRLIFPVYG